MFLQPAVPVRDWAERIPGIAGLPGWPRDADVVYFLENGKRRTGEIPRAPMKRYRLKHDDAVAIVAYLRSLAAVGGTEHAPSDAVPPVSTQ